MKNGNKGDFAAGKINCIDDEVYLTFKWNKIFSPFIIKKIYQ